MASIYDSISSWSSSTTYNKYDIVKGSDNKFYYSIINSNVGITNNPVTTTNLQVDWDGYILLNGILIPNFFWEPSYASSIRNEPRVKRLRFGNGYEQRISDSINFNLINIQLQFQLRTEKETVSILHFLNERAGKESFVYNPPVVLAKSNFTTRFVCPSWELNYVSFNNYSISATFEEVSA
jgi:phage-related protein